METMIPLIVGAIFWVLFGMIILSCVMIAGKSLSGKPPSANDDEDEEC